MSSKQRVTTILRGALKGWLGTVLFLLLLVAIGFGIRYIERKRLIAREPLIFELIGVDPARLSSLTLLQKGSDSALPPQKFVFERDDGAWRLTAPLDALVNPFALEPIVDILYRPSLVRYPVDQVNRAAARLDTPPFQLIFDGHLVTFGTTDPIYHRRYCQIGETVHLLNDDFSHRLAQELDAFLAP